MTDSSNFKKIKKVLIANRGEIVFRIHKTLKKMGIKTVSIYSSIDTNSYHRFVTDESIDIGGTSSSESYLSFDKILHAIRITEADAVHPGFGFLSENYKFAQFLKQNGIIFIGPSFECIKALGDKIESKIIAESAGVNVIPGTKEAVCSFDDSIKIASSIGYPVMIKAAAGGGGKGMRVIYSETDLKSSFEIAQSEALSSFKDDRVFIEKFIENPRHIEIQLIGDQYGNVIHLGERECSIQRRNQKIIEEAPSPFIINTGEKGLKLREQMCSQSVALAKKIGYYSAGTVEFVVDKDHNFYFLEVNTRVQVEHPVTEESIRIKKKGNPEKVDIIEQMVLIAQGEEIKIKQNDVFFDAHAIETRIYAEDPDNNFSPSSGRITSYNEPCMDNVRVESGVRKGSDISIYYDPMIAKICGYGSNRDDALRHLKSGLAELVIISDTLKTNIDFLENIIRLKKFEEADFSTSFIANQYKDGFSCAFPLCSFKDANDYLKEQLEQFLVANLVICFSNVQFMSAHGLIFANEIEGKFFFSGFYQNKRHSYIIEIMKNGDYLEIISIDDCKIGKHYCTLDKMPTLVAIQECKKAGARGLNKNPVIYFKYQSLDYNKSEVAHNGLRSTLSGYPESQIQMLENIIDFHDDLSLAESSNMSLSAPIPGVIVEISASEGDVMVKGDKLLTLESMKMQNLLTAKTDGLKVSNILVKLGDIVKSGQVLVEFKPCDERPNT